MDLKHLEKKSEQSVRNSLRTNNWIKTVLRLTIIDIKNGLQAAFQFRAFKKHNKQVVARFIKNNHHID